MTSVAASNPYDSLGMTQFADQSNTRLGQQDFLDLMVTQLQNQDPTKPMDSDQFLGQLAQFASVSGLDQLNSSFGALASSLVSTQALEAAPLVGKDVLVPSDYGYLGTEGSLRGSADLPYDSVNVQVTITNDAGDIVYQEALGSNDAGTVGFEWNGLSTTGERLPAGNYNIDVTAETASGTESLSTLAFARIESVVFGQFGDPIQLDLLGLDDVTFDQIRQIG